MLVTDRTLPELARAKEGHRINASWYNLEEILNGNLHQRIRELQKEELQ